MATSHPNLTGVELHAAGWVQATDPGTVGAGKVWFDTSTAAPFSLKLRNVGNTGWDLVGSAGAAAAGVRATVAVTTASLAANAIENDSVIVGKSGVLMRVVTSGPARVRVYTTIAQRTADASRSVGTDPTGMHGVLLDLVTDASTLNFILSPLVTYSNGESTPVNTIPIAITNTDTAAAAITVTFTYLSLEA